MSGTNPAEGANTPPRPSSSSTHIAVSLHSTPEEELFAAAEAMREAMRSQSRKPRAAPTSPPPPPTSAPRRTSNARPPTATLPSRTPSPSSPTTTAATSTATTASSTSTASSTGHPPESGSDHPDDGDDNDSASSTTSSPSMARHRSRDPASMTSSVREHVYEGGLRYHAYRAGKYAFPNDEVEQNRDDMKHSMTLMLCRGEYFYAPVGGVLEGGGEVLDLGTGTGIWAMELGDKYPNTTITGIDLSPIQPTYVPENVHFFVDDFEEEWVDPDDKYDFIHLRHTLHSVQDTQALFRRVLRHLKPGGYFEVQEIAFVPQSDDETLTPTTPYALRDYLAYMASGMRALGSDIYAVHSLADELAAAGFADVRKTTHKCPLGVWPRDKRLRCCGLFLRTVIMDGLRGLSRRPLMALGWTQLQIEMFLVEVRKAVMDEGVHSYVTLHVVHGRKPES